MGSMTKEQKRSDLDDNCGHSGLAEAYAKEHGMVCVYPAANELFLDIDLDFEYTHFQFAFPMFQQLYPGAEIKSNTPSKSNTGADNECRHIIITMPRALQSTEERVMLQAILGSDPKRELLTLKNISDGDATPTLFFELKPALTLEDIIL